MKGLVIPVAGPVREFDLAELAAEHGTRLKALQHLVGGWIQAVPLAGHDDTTTYVNEEGKFECEPNPRATVLMKSVTRSLFPSDFISGPLVVIGFDIEKGDDLDTGGHQDLSDEVAELVRALPGAGEGVKA